VQFFLRRDGNLALTDCGRRGAAQGDSVIAACRSDRMQDLGNNVPYSAYLEAFSQIRAPIIRAGARCRARVRVAGARFPRPLNSAASRKEINQFVAFLGADSPECPMTDCGRL